MGKHSLFRWPMRRFMRDMGGIPDRPVRARQLRSSRWSPTFDRRDAPRAGHRARGDALDATGSWRSGFYHIAMGAKVPIVPAWIDRDAARGTHRPGDHADRRLSRRPCAIWPTFYRAVDPDNPRFREIDRHAAAVFPSPPPTR